MQIEVGPAAGDFRRSSHDRRNHPCTVPELTRNASIKLNARVSLRRRPFPLSISHRTISPRPGPPWQSRQAIILRLAALLFASWSNGVVWRKRRTIGVRLSQLPCGANMAREADRKARDLRKRFVLWSARKAGGRVAAQMDEAGLRALLSPAGADRGRLKRR